MKNPHWERTRDPRRYAMLQKIKKRFLPEREYNIYAGMLFGYKKIPPSVMVDSDGHVCYLIKPE